MKAAELQPTHGVVGIESGSRAGGRSGTERAESREQAASPNYRVDKCDAKADSVPGEEWPQSAAK